MCISFIKNVYMLKKKNTAKNVYMYKAYELLDV